MAKETKVHIKDKARRAWKNSGNIIGPSDPRFDNPDLRVHGNTEHFRAQENHNYK